MECNVSIVKVSIHKLVYKIVIKNQNPVYLDHWKYLSLNRALSIPP